MSKPLICWFQGYIFCQNWLFSSPRIKQKLKILVLARNLKLVIRNKSGLSGTKLGTQNWLFGTKVGTENWLSWIRNNILKITFILKIVETFPYLVNLSNIVIKLIGSLQLFLIQDNQFLVPTFVPDNQFWVPTFVPDNPFWVPSFVPDNQF